MNRILYHIFQGCNDKFEAIVRNVTMSKSYSLVELVETKNKIFYLASLALSQTQPARSLREIANFRIN
ncbi:MAG: hypothetical protein KGQ36_04690 [Rickettsiales bacterium]|nr:hypothetical protein [Rickettsiales bacterium]